MPDFNYPFGYCTNVHAGPTLEAAKSNLLLYSAQVRQAVAPDGVLPVGLWLAEEAAYSLLEQHQSQAFRDWLSENGFAAYTLNGFPQGDFHQSVVKHQVYEPTWTCQSRLRYTLSLAEILAVLLPEGATGSISTLPLGWPHAPWHADELKLAADHLLTAAEALAKLSASSGRHIVLAIEPEPGCVLNTAPEIVEFFTHYLFSSPSRSAAQNHLSVCHDVCHSGVMFEAQTAALQSYLDAGIRVGKVQISSAVHVPWDHCTNAEQRRLMTEQLGTFNEPKYLHQTTRCTPEGQLAELCSDLPKALTTWLDPNSCPREPWRIHFHVPIFVDGFGQLTTTQSDIVDATRFLETHRNHQVGEQPWFTGHYEIETYAWPVLPPSLAVSDLAEGITRELNYFSNLLEQSTLS